MTREKTVILALGAAASLLFAPFLVGSLRGKAQEGNTMMNDKPVGKNAGEDCHCGKTGKDCVCKGEDCRSSCGGGGLTERCAEVVPAGE